MAIDSTAFLRSHIRAFHALGGIPRRILYDNLKTAVLGRTADGAIRWQPRFLDFATYYGYSPQACRPYRAQTKGKVERGIAYVRGNFWPGLHFGDLADRNAQAERSAREVANARVHATTGAIPAARLGAEGLRPLAGKSDHDTSLICYRWSSRDCFISYGHNFYSVPAASAGRQVLVRETEGAEAIITSLHGEELARHRLLHGIHVRGGDAAHAAAFQAPPVILGAGGTAPPAHPGRAGGRRPRSARIRAPDGGHR